MTVSSASASQKFEGIQATRFLAAFLVLVTHSTFYVSTRITPGSNLWVNGAQGVSIFFVISGFVMMLSASALMGQPGAVRRFVTGRLVRIVPLYWTLNIVKLGLLVFVPSMVLAHPTVSNVVLSLLFVPSRNSGGIVETFYGVGWTLNFEMFFYLVVAVALAIKRPILSVVTPVLIAFAALSLIRTDAWPAVTDLCRPIVLNFLWGAAIAWLHLRGIRLPAVAALGFVAAGVAAIILSPDAFGLQFPYGLLVFGIVSLEPWLKGRVPRWLIFGGDASYSLYLVHPLVGVAVTVVLHRLNIVSAPLAMAMIIAVCLAVAAVTYRYFERPVTEALQRRFRLRREPRPAQRAPRT